MRRRLVSSNGDSRLGKQHTGQVVHAAVVSHGAHDPFGIVGIGHVGVRDGAPFDVFFAGLSVMMVRICEGLMVRERGSWCLLFAGPIARLSHESLKEPTHERYGEHEEAECQADAHGDSTEERFGTHVGTEMEIGSVEVTLLEQTPGSVDERDVSRALNAVSEETAESMFHAKAGQTLVEGLAVRLLGWLHVGKSPS